MTQPYQKLFNTIQEIEAAGKVKLSADERATIERETRDLINKSQAKNYKFASVIPPGFDELLDKLRSADAEEAYSLVKGFMADEGEPKGDAPDFGGDKGMDDKPDFGGDKEDKGDKPAFLDDKGDDDDDDDDKPEKKKDEKSDKKDDDKGDKKEDKSEKKDDGKEDKPAFIEDKEKVLARIRRQKARRSATDMSDELYEQIINDPCLDDPAVGTLAEFANQHSGGHSSQEWAGKNDLIQAISLIEGVSAPWQGALLDTANGILTGGGAAFGGTPKGDIHAFLDTLRQALNYDEFYSDEGYETDIGKGRYEGRRARALRRRKAQEGPPMDREKMMDDKPTDKGLGRGEGPKLDGKGPHGPGKMRDLKDKDKDKEKQPSMDEMGIDDKDVDPTISLRAKKIRVKVTAERNVIAYHEDHGPVFILTPGTKTKRNKQAMVRLANRAYGLAVYNGFAVAAKTLGAKMLHTAGVDDDVELVTEETPVTPVTDGVLEEAEGVTTEEEPDEKNVGDDTQADADDDMEQEPAKIARYKRITKRHTKKRRSQDISDGVDTFTEEMPESKPSTVTEGEDDVAEETQDTPNDNVLDDEQVDFKAAKKLEANYKKLYAARLKKAEEMFVKKFAQCMRVASKRMLLNHDENPWKIASADVLMSSDVEFENGERFRAMPEHVAVQLTELISTEGHEDFVRHLMDRTADLMEKSPDYLKDVEADIARLRPVAVDVATAPARPKQASRANSMRKAASTGNFGLTDKAATAQPTDTKTSLRTAMNGNSSKVNRDLGRLKR